MTTAQMDYLRPVNKVPMSADAHGRCRRQSRRVGVEYLPDSAPGSVQDSVRASVQNRAITLAADGIQVRSRVDARGFIVHDSRPNTGGDPNQPVA